MRNALSSTIIAVAIACLAAPATAQDYPSRPLRVIVPLPAGGAVDTVVRSMAHRLMGSIGENVIVDNRPGAGGSIGMETAMAASPDGYTVVAIGATQLIYPLIYKARYDLLRDFEPVSQMTAQGYVVIVHPSLPVHSVSDLVQHLKANPGKLNFASSGIGGTIHLTGELFMDATGTQMTHVPYKGGGPALTDVIRGEVQMHFSVVISAIPHIQSGRLKPLAIGGEQRFVTLPRVPTFAEAGLAGFDLRPWQGMFAPAGTPRPIVDRLSGEVGKIVSMPEVRDKLVSLGMEPLVSTPEQFAVLLQADMAKAAKVIKVANIRLN
ncbi:MAG: tripartite tricarboxylate transporter substrate binding protein [Betaproteobacteria bacterium]|nr:tripartite tricarboxylate transporter substrate binding protein [Betaproteobacteria bacterium]